MAAWIVFRMHVQYLSYKSCVELYCVAYLWSESLVSCTCTPAVPVTLRALPWQILAITTTQELYIQTIVCVDLFCLQVLMIGESGVGKSTLVGRLCEDRFMPEHRQYTLGMYNGYRMT